MSRVFNVVLVLLFTVMLTLNVLQVVFRYLVHSPLYWSEEAAIYANVVLVFLAVPVLIRDREHIVIDLLGSRRQGAALRVVDTLQFVLTALIMGIFGVLAAEYLLSVIQRNAFSTALRLPMWLPVAPMAFGFILGSLLSLWAAIALWRRRATGEAK